MYATQKKMCAKSVQTTQVSKQAETPVGGRVQSHKCHTAAASMDVLLEWHMPTEQNGAGGQDTTLQGSLNHSGRKKKSKGRIPSTNTNCDLRQVRVASVSH